MATPVQRMYESTDRGEVLVLGIDPKDSSKTLSVTFSSQPQPPYLAVVTFKDEYGHENEKAQLLCDRIENSKPFLRGRIKYVPSASELQAKRKAEAQEAKCEEYRALLADNTLDLNLKDKDIEKVYEFADLIGVETEGKTKKLPKLSLIKAIYAKLGMPDPYGNQPAEKPVAASVSESKQPKKQTPKSKDK